MNELSNQEVVNLIAQLRPAAASTPLGTELVAQHVDWAKLREAEQEMEERGFEEKSLNMWVSKEDDSVYVIPR